MKVKIADIKIGDRFRKDIGDIEELHRSIAENGLLHPVVLSAENELIAGLRRLRACQMLGWDEIDVTVIDPVNVDMKIAERDENAQRKDLTVSEALEVEAYFAALEKPKAKERQGRPGKERSAKFAERTKGRAREKAAAATGYSHETLRKARAVKQAAETDTDLAPVAEEMERTGKVHPAYRKVEKRKRRTKAEIEAAHKKKLNEYHHSQYEAICGMYEDLPREWRAKVREFIAECEKK